MKKFRMIALLLTLAMMFSLLLSVSASTVVKTFDLTDTCDFGPDTGMLQATFDKDTAETYFEFYYSQSDAEAIKYYNEADLGYAGIDIKNVPSDYYFGIDMMEAYSISTTLPNPKTDIENDDILGSRNEEAEVVALGTILGGVMYKMNVLWHDYRTGASSDYGEWRVNAELSKKGVFDYNVEKWSPIVTLPYGTQNGTAALGGSDMVSTDNVQTNVAQSADETESTRATITFAQYMSFSEFAEYVAAYDIDVVQLQLRGLTADGERVSIFSRTDIGMDETERILNAQASRGGYTIIGITGVNAAFSPRAFTAVQEDPRTYSVDTVSELQFARSATDHAKAAGAFPQTLTWQLEDMGLLGK